MCSTPNYISFAPLQPDSLALELSIQTSLEERLCEGTWVQRELWDPGESSAVSGGGLSL